jgi:deoxyribodipyrimidine photo-lyase
MRHIPNTWLFEPWKMPVELQHAVGIRPGSELATPVVDLAVATRESKHMLHARRNTTEVRNGKEAVIEKHASRMTLRRSTKAKSATTSSEQQLGFDF